MKIKQKISISVIFTVICVLVFGMIAIQGIHFGKNEFKGNYTGEFKALAEENEPTNPIGATKGIVSVDESYLLMTTLLDIDTTQYKSIGYKVTEEGKNEVSYSSNKFYSGFTVNSNTTPVTYKVEDIYGQDAASKVMLVQEISYDFQKNYSIKPFIVTNEDASVEGTVRTKQKEGMIIEENKTNRIEAEELDTSKLIAQKDTNGPTIEYFGGRGLANISGGYQMFSIKSDKDVNVAFSINFANIEGGSILKYVTAVNVNGEDISLIDGQVAKGDTSTSLFWNVCDVKLAVISLKKDKIYNFKIEVNSGNLDAYSFNVVEEQGLVVPDSSVGNV